MSNRETIDQRLNGYGQLIEQEAKETGLNLALACALVEQESGGNNIFGCDGGRVGDQPPYCAQPVTAERVAKLRASPFQNGVGLTQLTDDSFLQQADDLGGAHIPRYQLRVGFGLLADLMKRLGRFQGKAAYNAGENNWQAGSNYARQLTEKQMEWLKLLDKGDEKVVTGQDVFEACKLLLRAPYRFWSNGPLPMWENDGQGHPPSADYLLNGPGVMCSDLISWGMLVAGVDPNLVAYGTEAMGDNWLVDEQPFDPNTPGEVGAVALAPYQEADLAHQGHIALFGPDGEILLQSLTFNGAITPGVTMDYDQQTTYNWGGDTEFTIYGKLPGVTYSGTPSPIGKAWWDHGTGWYEIHEDWSCTWHKGDE